MRIFMLGWEFPPYISGGLGTACEGLTRGLTQKGAQITFVLPRSVNGGPSPTVKVLSPRQVRLARQRAAEESARKISFHVVPTTLSTPYQATAAVAGESAAPSSPQPVQEDVGDSQDCGLTGETPAITRYGGDLMSEAQRYAELCVDLAKHEQFDVIHAHDWLTFPAAMALAAASGKPFVAHVHSTEFDRAGESHLHRRIFEIERQGLQAATRIIAVSHLTRRILETRYSIDPAKIDVVYNAVENGGPVRVQPRLAAIRSSDRIVLYLGRITMQKGPEYFIAAAKKVLDVIDDVKFIMAGSGDMVKEVMNLAARQGIGGKVLFTGFLRGADVHRVFEMADVYVMPSVSEPFGIAALEAITHDVPVIISRQSGVSEVVKHALKVDFWDTDEIANKIIAVLRHPPLARMLTEQADMEIRTLTWSGAAERCLACYDRACAAATV